MKPDSRISGSTSVRTSGHQPGDGGGLPSDAQLLDQFFTDRDQAAFASLVQRHGPLVLGVCRRILRNEADAEDAFQATFLVLAIKGRSIRKRDSLAEWLFGVAIRTAGKLQKGNSRRNALREKLMTSRQPTTTANEAETNEVNVIVDHEIARLPEKYRRPVVLCWLEGTSKSLAAAQLGCPEGTIATRLAKARKLLRMRLARRGITAAAIGGGLAAVERSSVAGVPPTLAVATTHAVTTFSSAATTAGIASNTAMPLAQGVIRTMFITKVKVTAVLALALLLTAAAVAQITRSARTAPTPPTLAEKLPAQPAPTTRPAGVDAAADAILEKSLAELNAFRAYSMHFEGTDIILHHGSNDPEYTRFSGETFSMDVRVDRPKWDLISQDWLLRSEKNEKSPNMKMRSIWDGRRRIHRQQSASPGPQHVEAVVSPDYKDFRELPGQFLYGLAWGDKSPMVEVLRDSGLARLRSEREDVSGHSCAVIDARTDRGMYTLWLDFSAGFQLRQAKVKRNAGGLWFDKRLPADGTELTTIGVELGIHDVQIDPIGGHFVPIAGVVERKEIFGGGHYELISETAKRSDFRVNPDFQAMGAFVMDGIPEGTPVYNTYREGPLAGVKLAWRHGDAVFDGVYPTRLARTRPTRQPAVGTVAPEIVGTDMDGKPLKLSDYRGKVVVLVFWGTWCGPCMGMVPHERALMRWLGGKPFALLGVNSDDNRQEAKAVTQKEQMTWPSWFDGGTKGPIAELWDVQSWPTICVIDPKGVISYIDLSDQKLEQEVDALLKEIK